METQITRLRLTPSNTLREQWLLQLHQAYRRGHLRLLKRIHALLYVSEGKAASEIMATLQLNQQSVYNYVKALILHGLNSLDYWRPSSHPPKLTQSQKQELCAIIDQDPETAGHDCGCWTTALLQDVILTRFGIEGRTSLNRRKPYRIDKSAVPGTLTPFYSWR